MIDPKVIQNNFDKQFIYPEDINYNHQILCIIGTVDLNRLIYRK